MVDLQATGWISADEAAARLNVTGASVRHWIRTGQLPATRVGQRWRIRENDLERMVVQSSEAGR